MSPFPRASRRILRHRRVRARLSGTAERPRLAVFRSLKHIRVQLVDDMAGRTLLSASDGELKTSKGVTPRERALAVGKLLAEKALAKGIAAVVFDRGGYAYQGRVQALAEGARQAGLTF